MTRQITIDKNVVIYYDQITKLRNEISDLLLDTNFAITAVGFVDGVSFMDERKGIFMPLQKVEHFCIALGHTTYGASIYIALPDQMPHSAICASHVKRCLQKYRLAKNKIQCRILLNKVV